MTTLAATRGESEQAVIEVIDESDTAVVGHYDGASLVGYITVNAPVSVAAIVAALPGNGWQGNPACDEWLEWAKTQRGE